MLFCTHSFISRIIWCLICLSVQIYFSGFVFGDLKYFIELGTWREMTNLYLTHISVSVSRNRRKANKGLVHSQTNRLRMCADMMWRLVCSPKCSLCRLYHWPFHIPQPACGSRPSLAATLHALFELSLVVGRFVCFWLWYVDPLLLYFYSQRNANRLFPCLQHLVVYWQKIAVNFQIEADLKKKFS